MTPGFELLSQIKYLMMDGFATNLNQIKICYVRMNWLLGLCGSMYGFWC